MSEIKQKCELNDCNRAASKRCYCCNKSVCTRHFNEHIEAIRAQVNPLVDSINTMTEKIRDLTVEQITEASFALLNKWKDDMHRLADEIFQTKIKQIEDLVEGNKEKFIEHKKQQWETIMKIQDDARQLAEDGDATYEQITLLKNKLATIDTNLTSFRASFLSINTQLPRQELVTVSSKSSTVSSKSPASSAKERCRMRNPEIVVQPIVSPVPRPNSVVTPTTNLSIFNYYQPTQPPQFSFGSIINPQVTSSPSTSVTPSFSFGAPRSAPTAVSSFPFTPVTSINNTSVFSSAWPSTVPITTSTNMAPTFGSSLVTSIRPTQSIFGGSATTTSTVTNSPFGFGSTSLFGVTPTAAPFTPTNISKK